MTKATLITGVLESKLYAGVGAAKVVERPQLLPPEGLLGGAVRVVCISAPAGYGKSTLMSGWHRQLLQRSIQCAWLSVDTDDDNPIRLMRHVIAAFQGVDSAVGEVALEELAADCADDARAALESLAHDLSQRSDRIVLFIDDLQSISSEHSLSIINWLLNHSPPNYQYVIGARAITHLRLSTLRVNGRLLELTTQDLRFSRDEAARFIQDRIPYSLQPAMVEQLVQKVEGWPAALELATLALRSGDDSERVIEQFSGSDLNVVDYLSEVVLDRLDAHSRRFLLHISLFDRISVSLAMEVTGERNAHERLSDIYRANLFLIPLDQNAKWYRFHPIAADFLRQRFRRDFGNPSPVVCSGAHWLYQQGQLETAINAVLEVQDWDMAARWIADSVEALVYRSGYHHTILRWMEQLPEEWVDRYPTIRFHYAIALSLSPYQQESDAQLHYLEQLCERLSENTAHDNQLIDQITRDVALQKAMSAALRDDGKMAGEAAGVWLERWPDAPLTRSGAAALVRAYSFMMSSEIKHGHQWNDTAKGWMHKVDNWYGLAWTQYTEALLHINSGDYLAARHASEEGQELLRRHLDGHPRHMAMLHSVLAAVAYEFDELEQARGHLEICMSRVGESGPCDSLLLSFLTAARVERLLNGEAAGLDILHKGQSLSERRGLQRATLSLVAEECQWHCRAGHFEEALRVARHFKLNLQNTPVEELTLLAKLSYMLHTQPDEVLHALQTPLANSLEQGLYHRWVQYMLLKAMAQQKIGKQSAALGSLLDALKVASQRNYFRVIIDGEGKLTDLLELIDLSMLGDQESVGLIKRLLDAMGGQATPQQDSQPLTEPLSKRELDILKRLESGLSNKELSGTIFISEGTLKWHLHNIYSKLGAKNRTGALTKARSLRLI